MTRTADITLAILAGGEGRRMGRAKSLLTLDDRPILEALLDRIAWPGETLLVTAPGREHPPGCERFAREAVDAVGGEGPLRGILTALSNSTTEITAITTVDMPNVGREQLEWLAGQLDARPDARGVFCRRAGKIESFPSVYRLSAIEIVTRRLDARELAVHRLARELDFETVDAPVEWDARVWANLNTPGDLEQLK